MPKRFSRTSRSKRAQRNAQQDTSREGSSLLVDAINDEGLRDMISYVATVIAELRSTGSMRWPPAAVDGSFVYLDDRKMKDGPTTISLEVEHRLIMAADHLGLASSMWMESNAAPLYASYGVLRSAIESSVMAWWIVMGEGQDERIDRAVRVRRKDAEYETIAVGALEILRPEKDDFETRFKSSCDLIMDRIGRPATDRKPPNMTQVLTAFDAEIPDMNLLESWRIASGMAHGFTWAAHHFSRDEWRGEGENSRYLHREVDLDFLALAHVKAHNALAHAYLAWVGISWPPPKVPGIISWEEATGLPGWGYVYEQVSWAR